MSANNIRNLLYPLLISFVLLLLPLLSTRTYLFRELCFHLPVNVYDGLLIIFGPCTINLKAFKYLYMMNNMNQYKKTQF